MAKSVFITGASSGIGRALAIELARRGRDLFLTARRLDALEELRAEIASASPASRVEVRRLDVTDDEDVARALGEAAEKMGRLDVVVANAGLGNSGLVGEGGIDRSRQIVETNLIGAIATVDAAVALLRRQEGGGQVVGIGSVAGVRGLPGSGSYSASKAGLRAFMEAVRAETHGEPITVTTLAPGYIDTPINQDVKSRPFLIDAEKGARIMADMIERGVGYSTVPRMPWTLLAPLLRVLPTSVLARSAPRRDG
ncbi:MAG TPA: SDR family oxidoreductase [Solirubrobacteraceae bacterium]|nr:SDR family oxidoreductase [Solirubrobacteraceae bacterium]